MDNELLTLIAVSILGLAEIARRISQYVGGKKASEITSVIELFARQTVEFLAGRHGTPGDEGALKPEDR